MRGPYEWVPPVYWYTDTKLGGPARLRDRDRPRPGAAPAREPEALPARRTSCGRSTRPGPITAAAGRSRTSRCSRRRWTRATDRRQGVEEYARKAQVAAYESHRAMFESFGARKYTATGVIQWMLNNAWPGMIWHLYDFYLRPGGSYFGTKKACEPLHVQYSYDDRSVLVVNSTLAAHDGLSGHGARRRHRRSARSSSARRRVDVGPDGVAKALELPAVDGLSPTYFVFLTLDDAQRPHGLAQRLLALGEARDARLGEVAVVRDAGRHVRGPHGPAAAAAGQVRASVRFEATGPDGRAQRADRERRRRRSPSSCARAFAAGRTATRCCRSSGTTTT